MIEALVLVFVTAIVAILILPLAARGSRENLDLANREIDAATAQNGEIAYRAALAQAVQPNTMRRAGEPASILAGQSEALSLVLASREASQCASAGMHGTLTLRIEQKGKGGALTCAGDRGRVLLLAWDAGQASFSYSAGGAWRSVWPEANTSAPSPAEVSYAPLVRFSLQTPHGGEIAWIARAGWTEPADTDLTGAQEPTQVVAND
jgi:hypothetical protein